MALDHDDRTARLLDDAQDVAVATIRPLIEHIYEQAGPAAAIAAAAEIADAAAQELTQTVVTAVLTGSSWSEVADVFSISRQAAQQRWGRAVEAARHMGSANGLPTR